MNKWLIYWLLNIVGIAGLLSTLFALPYHLLPSEIMGVIGGCWLMGFVVLARLVVLKSNK